MHGTILLAVLLAAGAETPPADSVPYGVAAWPVELGNHRAVVEGRTIACLGRLAPHRSGPRVAAGRGARGVTRITRVPDELP